MATVLASAFQQLAHKVLRHGNGKRIKHRKRLADARKVFAAEVNAVTEHVIRFERTVFANSHRLLVQNVGFAVVENIETRFFNALAVIVFFVKHKVAFRPAGPLYPGLFG